VVADVLATEFGPRAASAGHTLHVDHRRPVLARGDEARILQIGAHTGRKRGGAHPAGTAIVLEVGGESAAATLAVSDDGAGIPERPGRPCSSASSGSGRACLGQRPRLAIAVSSPS